MLTLSTIRFQSCQKVTSFLPDFGYVEFIHPFNAQLAADCKEHFINGKKASLQFFKTKDNSKREQKPQEAMEAYGNQGHINWDLRQDNYENMGLHHIPSFAQQAHESYYSNHDSAAFEYFRGAAFEPYLNNKRSYIVPGKRSRQPHSSFGKGLTSASRISEFYSMVKLRVASTEMNHYSANLQFNRYAHH